MNETSGGTKSAEGAGSAKKPAPWKGVVRVVVALGLLGLVLWFVPWSDRLTWPEKYGSETLIGRIVDEKGELAFVVEHGPRAGETVVVTPELQAQEQPQAGLKTTAMRLVRAPQSLILALLLYVAGAMISFQRWLVLLRAAHVDAQFWRVQKLGFFGLFFSNIIPGMTGGDLVKAIMVARDHPEQRPAAVLSVIVDRAIGLLGLALIATGVLLFQLDRFASMAAWLGLILVAIVATGAMVMSRRLRRALRLDRLLGALPFAEHLKKLDRAALLYREARWQIVYSIGVSLVVHTMILTAIGVLGRAIGIQIPFLDYYALAPLALIAQSLPLTPGGVGVGEAAFISFFKQAGVASAAAFALSVAYRVVQFFVSLIGGILLLTRHEPRVSRTELEQSGIDGGGSGVGGPGPTSPVAAAAQR